MVKCGKAPWNWHSVQSREEKLVWPSQHHQQKVSETLSREGIVPAHCTQFFEGSGYHLCFSLRLL